jgi:hypothetical protein
MFRIISAYGFERDAITRTNAHVDQATLPSDDELVAASSLRYLSRTRALLPVSKRAPSRPEGQITLSPSRKRAARASSRRFLGPRR